MTNRILAYEAKVQGTIDTGRKPDGSPVGDLVKLEQGLDLSVIEIVAYQNAQARAHATGILTTAEAQIVYQSISEGSASGWAEGVSLARKVTITNLIGELIMRGARR